MAAFSDAQFQQFLATLTVNQQANSKGSFSRCSTRFKGERDPVKVEEFIATIKVYKDIERIDDAEAMQGLPLLLEENAATWWQGVKDEANNWENAIKLIRDSRSIEASI